MINLDEHSIYNHDFKLVTVPLSIAKQAVQEALEMNSPQINSGLEEAMELIHKSLSEMNGANRKFK